MQRARLIVRHFFLLVSALALGGELRAASLDTAADAVVGQAGFTSAAAGAGATGVSSPAGAAADRVSGRLWVADFGNHRVLGWSSAAAFTNGQAADVVIGQATFSGTLANRGGSPTSATLNAPASVAVDTGGNLYVADRDNHRILRFAPPFTSGMSAVQVFGQAGSFTTATANKGGISASSISGPTDAVPATGGALYVVDANNHRVLYYAAASSGGGVADRVIGQANFTSGALAATGPSTLNLPQAAAIDPTGTSLYVMDFGNNRVLRFAAPYSQTAGASALQVFGQSSFLTSGTAFGAAGFNAPTGVAVDPAGRLFVADSSNHRVLQFDTPFVSTYADRVYGQAGFNDVTGNRGGAPAAGTFYFPTRMGFDAAGNMFVAEYGNNRVTRFAIPNPPALAPINPSASAPVDPQYANQWYLQPSASGGIGVAGAWAQTTGSNSVVVAVIDNGILSHADLAGRTLPGYDFVDARRSNDGGGRDADPADPGDWVTATESTTEGGEFFGCPVSDSSWHGTRIAGIIGAAANGLGIAGINWQSKILPVRAIGKCGGYASDIVDAIRWAAGMPVAGVPNNPNPARVINLSFATPGACDATFQNAVDDVTSLGVVVVAAAGNNGLNASLYTPASCNNVLSVTAVDRNGAKPAYANTGPDVTLAAAGGVGTATDGVLGLSSTGTTIPQSDTYTYSQGTSLAAAEVSGVASLLLSLRPYLKSDQVRQILAGTARPFPTGTSADCTYATCGAGIVNAQAAVQAATSVFGYGRSGVAAYAATSIALRTDGTVMQWGEDFFGAFGPLQQPYDKVNANVIPGLDGIVQVAAGAWYGVALRNDGSVWTWGANQSGQLGNGTTAATASLVQAAGLGNVIHVAAGGVDAGPAFPYYAMAVKADGTVWMWGGGNGTPQQVAGIADAVAGALTENHRLVLKREGTVWAWGSNTVGQLGNGSTTDSATPVQVAGLTGIAAIVAGPTVLGGSANFAIKRDGSLWAWGYNVNGQLGDGTHVQRNAPVRVTGIDDVRMVAAGYYHAIAVKGDGSVWTWGGNNLGQLGNESSVGSPVPAQVPGLRDAVSVAAGGFHSLASLANGRTYGWGANNSGQVGSGNLLSPYLVPVGVYDNLASTVLNLGSANPLTFTPVANSSPGGSVTSETITLSGIGTNVAVTVENGQYSKNGAAFTTAQSIASDGDTFRLDTIGAAVTGLGQSRTVTLRIGSRTLDWVIASANADTTPVPFTLGSAVSAVPSALLQSAAVQVLGINTPVPISVVGGDYRACFGPCTTEAYTSIPGTVRYGQTVQVRAQSPAGAGSNTATLTIGGVSGSFIAITEDGGFNGRRPGVTAGATSSVVLAGDGTLWVLGHAVGTADLYNTYQLTRIGGIAGVKRIAAGKNHFVALRDDGTVWTWGENVDGQLGHGDYLNRNIPTQISDLENVIEVTAGHRHTLVLKADGTIWAWGANESGQLGVGSQVAVASPVLVAGLGSVIRIAGGGRHSLAIRSDGAVWTWGANNRGQLGTGAAGSNVLAPTPVSGLAGQYATIAAGENHSLALRVNGTVYAWGDNQYGQLGDGSFTQRNAPVALSSANGPVSGRGLAAGWNHSLVGGLGTAFIGSTPITTDRLLWVFGRNDSGQLGNGSTANSPVPVQLPANTVSVRVFAGGEAHSVIADSVLGAVYAWGASEWGQAGINGGSSASPATARKTDNSVLWTFGAQMADFEGRANAPANGFVESEARTLVGVGTSVPLSCPAGLFARVNGGALTGGCALTASDGDRITFAFRAPSGAGTAAQYSMTVGNPTRESRDFIVMTAASNDTTPDPVTLLPQANVAPGATVVSNEVRITGLGPAAPISVAGGEYSIGGGAFTSTEGVIYNNQTVRVRDTAAPTSGTAAAAMLTIGTTSTEFTTFTALQAGVTGIARFATSDSANFVLRTDGELYTWGWDRNGKLGLGLAPIFPYSPAHPSGEWFTVPFPTRMPTLSGIVDISVGTLAAAAVHADGSVWTWGYSIVGVLGDGTSSGTVRSYPGRVPSLSGMTAVSAGARHMLALKADGTVWSWGDNANSALGDGTTVPRSLPVQVLTAAGTPLTGVKAITAGFSLSMALKVDGTVWTWGHGALGNGVPFVDVAYATQIQVKNAGENPVPKVVAVSAGDLHAAAVREDGTVWTWGFNTYGQLGQGDNINHYSPTRIIPLSGANAVSCGFDHCLVRLTDGSLRAWGRNYGQLGDGTTIDRNAPVGVIGISGARAIFTGYDLSFAVLPDWSVVGWGNGVLGDNAGNSLIQANAPRTAPVPILGENGEGVLFAQVPDATPDPFAFLSNLNAARASVQTSNPINVRGVNVSVPISVAGGAYSVDGAAFTSAAGSVGNGAVIRVRGTAPAQFDAASTVTLTVGGTSATFSIATLRDPQTAAGSIKLATGSGHTLLLKTDGRLLAWGYNGNGQLGNGSLISSSAPQPVSVLTGVSDIAAGFHHTVAIKSDGTLWTWGYNVYGQLGYATAGLQSALPAQVSGATGVFLKVAAGGNHTLALKNDGTLWAWGDNSRGQLGDNTTVRRSNPVRVQNLPTNIIAISAGERHSLALTATGVVYAWGYNEFGQLGVGDTADRTLPMAVGALPATALIAAGGNHSLAASSAGQAFGWGKNDLGQVGDGSVVQRAAPVALAALANGVTMLAAGSDHSLALRSGAVYSWGWNGLGQLGRTPNSNGTTPVAIAALASGAIQIAAGGRYAAALRSGGLMELWGDNFFGQLANRTGNFSLAAALLNILRGDSIVSQLGAFSTSSVAVASTSAGTNAVDTALVDARLVFPSQVVGTVSEQRQFVLTNAASSALRDVAVTVAPAAFEFASPPCPTVLAPGETCSIGVRFRADAPGSFGGEVTVSSSAKGTEQRIALVATAVTGSGATLAMDRSNVSFPNQTNIGTTSAPQTITLSNVGAAAANLTAITASGDYARLHDCPPQLAPGASCAISITFTPGAAGERSGAISVATAASGTTLASLVGIGRVASGDTQAPTVPTGLSAAAASSSQINLAWAGSTDNVAVTAYQLYRGGVFRTTVNAPTLNFGDTGLTASTGYSYKVAACDAAGNCSAQSAQATATTLATGQFAHSPKLEAGFNLGSNALNITLNVAALFGNQDVPVTDVTSNIVSIWKWNAVAGRWAFYSPQLTGAGNTSYAASHSYDALSTINPGEGFWMNAINPITLPTQSGTAFSWSSVNFAALPSGFNLIAAANSVTPSQFNTNVSATPPAPGVIPTDNFVSLWVWDAALGKWYFYSPLLELSGGLPAVKAYADSHNYLHFQDAGKTLGIGTGFWVNRP